MLYVYAFSIAEFLYTVLMLITGKHTFIAICDVMYVMVSGVVTSRRYVILFRFICLCC